MGKYLRNDIVRPKTVFELAGLARRYRSSNYSQTDAQPDGLAGCQALCQPSAKLIAKTRREASSLKVLRRFEPRSLDSESRVLTVTP